MNKHPAFSLITIIAFYVGVTTPSRADLLTGLLFDSPLNGNFSDVSGNGFNGINFGATSTTDRFGTVNSAYRFDGIDDHATFSISSLPSAASPRTLSLWLKPEFIGQRSFNEHFVGYGSYPTGQAFGFAIGSDPLAGHNGRLFGYLGFDDVYTPYFVTGDWVFVTHTYDGSVARVYIDGTLLGERIITLTTQGDPFLTIGARYASESGGQFLDHYKGVIDDVRLWNRSLSQSEILEAYAAPEPSSIALIFLGAGLCKRRRTLRSRVSPESLH